MDDYQESLRYQIKWEKIQQRLFKSKIPDFVKFKVIPIARIHLLIFYAIIWK